jgi:hypothetical protein
VSPYFDAVKEERHHRQVADKTFEDKARIGLFKFLNARESSIARWIVKSKKDGKAVVEWEGTVEVDSGQWCCLNAFNMSLLCLILLTFSETNLEGDSRTSSKDA